MGEGGSTAGEHNFYPSIGWCDDPNHAGGDQGTTWLDHERASYD